MCRLNWILQRRIVGVLILCGLAVVSAEEKVQCCDHDLGV